tara:strand:- start:1074 stop:2045 length:972 start_codon:yes stop_codon:yes gene_type:complete
MKTLLITDLHFIDTLRGLLEAQKACIKRIFYEEEPDEVIIMGDLMMRRKPSPTVLLALQDTLKYMHNGGADLYILRGNHDSETKADDGVTALSLFEPYAKIITKTWYDHKAKRAFIPHYENEEIIKEGLDEVPNNYTVFGHFGYNGCLNSAGDADFSLRLSRFRNRTYLGHVHGHVRAENVTILGTPYSTNFGEAKKENFYGIIVDDRVEFKKITHGPRHMVLDFKDIEKSIEILDDKNYFTMLRVMLDNTDQELPYEDLRTLVDHLDIKFKPSFDEDQVSTYTPSRDLFSINEAILSDYIAGTTSDLTAEQIWEGYNLLREE